MSNRRLDLAVVRQQVANLLLEHPELADDDILRADLIEGQTEAFDLMRACEAKRREACTLAAGIASTMAELDARLGRFQRREQAMRTLIYRLMATADLRKLELPEATISIRNGVPKIIIMDEDEIPDAYMRVKKEPDRAKISAALKSGTTVEGTLLSNSEDTLSIRTR